MKFFNGPIKSGDKMAADLDYIPMPDSVVKLIKSSWAHEHQGLFRQSNLEVIRSRLCIIDPSGRDMWPEGC